MNEALHLKLTYTLDTVVPMAKPVSEGMVLMPLGYWLVVVACLVPWIWTFVVEPIRMELAGRMWSDQYQVWRCRHGNRPDIAG